MKRIVVLGMHRSGASSVARAIGLLGASMGDPAHLSKTWENTALRRVNDALLQGGGGSWDAPPAGEDWLEGPAATALLEQAEGALAVEFGTESPSVWKDPRTALTLPFWLEHFDEEPVVVLVHRHPAEVAASLRTASPVRTAHAFALWERYNVAALSAATALPTIVLDYGQVMTFPAEAATFLSRALDRCGAALPTDPARTEVGLAPALRHHTAKDTSHTDGLGLTDSQRAVFTLLDGLAGAHHPLAPPRALPTPSQHSVEILAMAATIHQLARERREARRSERKAKRTVRRASGGDVTTTRHRQTSRRA